MILPRREFLRLVGVAAGAAGMGGCGPQWAIPDARVALALRGPGLKSEVHTICGLCEGGCGLTVRLVDGLPVGLTGNPLHPLNRGGLCPVGHAGLDVLYSPQRLVQPLRRGADGELHSTTWEDALSEIAARLVELRAANEGHRVALLNGEPDLLFDDLARRFVHTLGSNNIAGSGETGALPFKLTQGIDHVPGFDLAGADLVLSFGLDLYEDGPAPLHAIAAMVAERPVAAKGAVIHIGTRLSPSAAKAEERVLIRPGTHAAFALGVAHVLVREGRCDDDFIAAHTSGFDDWTDENGRRHIGFRRLLLERYYPDRAAQLCGCEPAVILRVARRLAEAAAPVAMTGGEATSGSNATWTAMAAHSLNALIGAFDRPGGVVLPAPIPLTPMPPLDDPEAAAPPSIFTRGSEPALFGADPVETLADRALEGPDGLEVLFVVSANPVHESPAGERLHEAMERIPMVVALASFLDQTSEAADIVLPTSVFLERWQCSTTPPTVAFSTLGLAEPAVEALADTRHPGDILLELGHQVAGQDSDALPWPGYVDYLENRIEGLAVSRQGAIISGSFEESWAHFLEERGWRFLEPRNPDAFWADLTRQAGWWDPVLPRGDWERLFATSTGRYEFYSHALERRLLEFGGAGGDTDVDGALRRAIATLGLSAELDEVCLPHYEPPREEGRGDLTLIPFRPTTARGRLGATSPMVLEMFGYQVMSGWKTWAELAPETARELDLETGDEVLLESDRTSIAAVVNVRPGNTPGTVHVPLGLGHPDPTDVERRVGSNPIDVELTVRDPLDGALSVASTRVHLQLVRRRPQLGPPRAQLGGSS